MKMSELISAIGDENLVFQNLDQCVIRLDYTAKRGNTITFSTTMNIMGPHGTEKLGLVLWLDRDAISTALASAKGGAA